jgi:hypothetical protein
MKDNKNPKNVDVSLARMEKFCIKEVKSKKKN